MLGCSTKTIERGIAELDQFKDDSDAERVRRQGAGRKKIDSETPEEENLIQCLEVQTAGDPDQEDIVYTDLCPQKLSDRLTEMRSPVGRDAIAAKLDNAGIRLRQIRKSIPGGEHPDRDAQFGRIAELIDQYQDEGKRWFSVDTESEEDLGRLYRKGRVRRSSSFQVFDHDFSSWADGVLIPHGIDDLIRNSGHVILGLSHDTRPFAFNSLHWYWQRIGKKCYPDATSILLTCDGGGSNSAVQYIFKHDLERLIESIAIEIRVAHHPPYCSKYNPIERRFFPHLGRACSRMLFDCLDTVAEPMRTTKTHSGLRTTVSLINMLYETGRNATK